jgi:predicted transcriptional regulator
MHNECLFEIIFLRRYKKEHFMTSKEMAQKVISGLPEEATFDDIQYHLYVLECIERGEKEIEEGKVLTENEVRQRAAKWLK